MRMIKLAWKNFKREFSDYFSLILSLSFTILIFLNFQNLIFSEAFLQLGKHNQDYITICVQALSVVLGCFMFFFLGYATNVFLTRRKKEIGIYVFMGLTNHKIGTLYMIETVMTGVFAWVLGIILGLLTTRLFQMILLALSDIAIPLEFHFTWEPVLITSAVYFLFYGFFVVKGYLSIIRSSILNLVSASRQNEYVRQKFFLLILKTILGVGILCIGYYLAIKDGGQEVLENVLSAVVLVTIGVYLLFGGLIPLIFQGLSKNKRFLYSRQRNLWINSMIFRMKKNHRTYAMVCILILCSVTALATGFAMKERYHNMVHFSNTYTFQFLCNEPQNEKLFRETLEQEDALSYSSEASVLLLESALVDQEFYDTTYGVIPYSDIIEISERTGMELDFPEPSDDEIIVADHLPLLSLITARENMTTSINGKEYAQIERTKVPYLGEMQRMFSLLIVNDTEYERLLPLGTEVHTYNYQIAHPEKYEKARAATDILTEQDKNLGRISVDPQNSDIDWIKVLYSLAVFLFLVFIFSSGCILFMRQYNDAFEEVSRYQVLQKIGISQGTLKKSIAWELGISYIIPFVVMAISSYFSVHSLEKMMYNNLFFIQIVSVAVVLAILVVFYGLSVAAYWKNVGLHD